MKKLIKKLKFLKKIGVTAVKQSLEDEGASFKDIIIMRKITKAAKVDLNVKIGGCEAKNDIFFCKKIKTDSIVAPMVESEYALKKFIQCTGTKKNISLLVNLESNLSFENLNGIIKSKSFKFLDGVVIGRSDLTKSFGYGKQDVISNEMCDIVTDILKQSKAYGFKTLMGGNIGSSSINFIKKMYEMELLNIIETRNIIIDLDKVEIKDLNLLIKESLLFESDWMRYKAKYYNSIGNEYLERSKTIVDRIS